MPLGSILKSAIGRGHPNDQDDVMKLKEMFADSGLLAKPQDGFDPFFDRSLEDVITEFQAENNLLRDGFLRPGGETERNLRRTIDPAADTNPTSIFNLDIGGGVGNGATNDPQDLRNVSQALATLDHLKFDPSANAPGFMTAGLEDGIRAFQRDKNLLEDGQITPDGETIGVLRDAAEFRKLPAGTDEPRGFRTLPARNDIPARFEHAVVRHEPGEGPKPLELIDFRAEENEALAAAPEMESSTSQKGPNNSEFIVDNPDKTKIKWKELPIPKVRGKLEWKVRDGIRVKLGTVAIGVDSLDYTVDWFPLDKSGRPMTIVKKPGVKGGARCVCWVCRHYDSPWANYGYL